MSIENEDEVRGFIEGVSDEEFEIRTSGLGFGVGVEN
jgi:hypothetical protein